MTRDWLVLSFFVKLCIALAPFLRLEGDFNLGCKLEEAKDFAAASSTKAMLFSTPILFTIRTISEVPVTCGHHGLSAFKSTAEFFVLGVVLFCCYQVPTWLFQGWVSTLFWLVLLLALETLSESYVVPPVVQLLCGQ